MTHDLPPLPGPDLTFPSLNPYTGSDTHFYRSSTVEAYARAAIAADRVPKDEREATHGYALTLAKAIHAKHWAAATDWRPLPTTLGLLTQIDNMTAGLVQPSAALPVAQQEQAPVMYGIQSVCDGSMFQDIAMAGWFDSSEQMERLKSEPWVKNGSAKIVPLYLAAPVAPQTQEPVAWLVEWKSHGHGPQWWGFNYEPRSRADWCSEANKAIRFARKEDAERMRLHIIAVAGLTGMHDYERSITVTAHMWVDTTPAAPQAPAKALTDPLLLAIQTLNANPYNLTKSECIDVLQGLRGIGSDK